MKCELCKKNIETTFLGKIMGTFIMKGKKKYALCFECQKQQGNERDVIEKK